MSASSPSLPDLPFARRRSKTINDFGHPLRRATDVLLVLNILCFGAQWLTKDALTIWGAKVNSYIAAGQLWRLVTPAFLHSGLLHLAFNSHALNVIGPHVELVSGPARLATVYLASAVVGTATSVVFTPAPSVGASGAIFGLGAALGVFYWRHRAVLGKRSDAMLQSLAQTLAINGAYSLLNRRIDNWGHLGGLAGGALVAWLLGPKLVRTQEGETVDSPPVPLLAYRNAVASSPH